VDGTESWALDTGSFAWLHYLDDRSKLSCDLNAAYSHRIAEFVRTYLISEPVVAGYVGAIGSLLLSYRCEVFR